MKKQIVWSIVYSLAFVVCAFAGPAVPPTTQPNDAYPSIRGMWQEAPGIFIDITQKDGEWEAKCSYSLPGFGEVRWEMKGNITPNGNLHGTLHHTQAPKDWKLLQVRDGKLSSDGNTIAGTAEWENGSSEYTWTRKAQPAIQPADPADRAALQKAQAKVAAAQDALKKAREAAINQVEQTPEFKEALMDYEAAQEAMAKAGDVGKESQMKAAADKMSAGKRLNAMRETAFAADPVVADAVKAEAAARAELRDAQAKVDAVQAAATKQAEEEKRKAEDTAANWPWQQLKKGMTRKDALAVLDHNRETLQPDPNNPNNRWGKMLACNKTQDTTNGDREESIHWEVEEHHYVIVPDNWRPAVPMRVNLAPHPGGGSVIIDDGPDNFTKKNGEIDATFVDGKVVDFTETRTNEDK